MDFIKRDRNGGYNIQRSTFAMIMMIIALVSSISTVVAYTVTIKADVAWLKQEWQNAETNNPIQINKIEHRINTAEKDIIINEQKIIDIYDDISEIKSDVKELLKR